MEKFIPYKKLSKKESRRIGQARRQTWGNLKPGTGSVRFHEIQFRFFQSCSLCLLTTN